MYIILWLCGLGSVEDFIYIKCNFFQSTKLHLFAADCTESSQQYKYVYCTTDYSNNLIIVGSLSIHFSLFDPCLPCTFPLFKIVLKFACIFNYNFIILMKYLPSNIACVWSVTNCQTNNIINYVIRKSILFM